MARKDIRPGVNPVTSQMRTHQTRCPPSARRWVNGVKRFMEDQVSDTSVENTETSEPSAASPESLSQDSNGPTQEVSGENTEAKLPFNDPRSPEHARFKELREQAVTFKEELAKERAEREQLVSQYQQMQAYIQQMQAQNQTKSAPTYQPLVQRLKEIDPEFAQWQEKSLQAAEMLPQLQQQFQQMAAERDRRQAYDTLNSLYEKNSVPQEHRSLYERAIKTAVYEGELSGSKFSVNDIPKLFSQTHDEYSKFFDAYSRKQRESYVADKKKDATPASTTGGTTPGKASNTAKAMSMDDAKAMLVAALRKDKQKI